MWDRGSVEGGIFDKNTIFMFSDNYLSLKRCVKNKVEAGHTNLEVSLIEYEGDYYTEAFEVIRRVSSEFKVSLTVTGVPKSRVNLKNVSVYLKH